MRTVEAVVEESTGLNFFDFSNDTEEEFLAFFRENGYEPLLDLIKKGWDSEIVPELEDYREHFLGKSIIIDGEEKTILEVIDFRQEVGEDEQVGELTVLLEDGREASIIVRGLRGNIWYRKSEVTAH